MRPRDVRSAIPFPLSFCSLVSYLFPSATQAFYDAAFEGVRIVPALKSLMEVAPSPLLLLLLIIADVLVASAGVVYSVASLKSVIALVAVVVVAKRGRK